MMGARDGWTRKGHSLSQIGSTIRRPPRSKKLALSKPCAVRDLGEHLFGRPSCRQGLHPVLGSPHGRTATPQSQETVSSSSDELDLSRKLVHEARLYRWSDLESNPSLPPASPGVYAWFFDYGPRPRALPEIARSVTALPCSTWASHRRRGDRKVKRRCEAECGFTSGVTLMDRLFA